jgi:hypothetical protein
MPMPEAVSALLGPHRERRGMNTPPPLCQARVRRSAGRFYCV